MTKIIAAPIHYHGPGADVQLYADGDLMCRVTVWAPRIDRPWTAGYSRIDTDDMGHEEFETLDAAISWLAKQSIPDANEVAAAFRSAKWLIPAEGEDLGIATIDADGIRAAGYEPRFETVPPRAGLESKLWDLHEVPGKGVRGFICHPAAVWLNETIPHVHIEVEEETGAATLRRNLPESDQPAVCHLIDIEYPSEGHLWAALFDVFGDVFGPSEGAPDE